MKIYSLSLAAILVFAFASCSTNRVVPSSEFTTYEISADDVNSIDVSASIKVEFTQADAVSVKVSCPENLVDMLNVNVKDATLYAGFKPNTMIDGNCGVTITVSAPTLKSIDASSSSRFEMTGSLVQDCGLSIDASSSANVNLYKLSVSGVDIESSSSSSVDISGVNAVSLDIDCSMSARVNISDIRSLDVDAEASSAATITLSGVARTAEYDASSASTINAKGLRVERVESASASSAASVRCAANTCKNITEKSSGSVTCNK